MALGNVSPSHQDSPPTSDPSRELLDVLPLLDAKEYASAEAKLRTIIENAKADANLKAVAEGLLGSCRKGAGRFDEARDLLERSLGALDGSLSLERMLYVPILANDLADVYWTVSSVSLNEGKVGDATVLLEKLRLLIAAHRDRKEFKTVKHEGLALFNEGVLAANDPTTALEKFGALLSPPYREYFDQQNALTFVIGLAFRNVGRLNLAQNETANAIEHLDKALQYFDRDSEDAKAVLEDLTKAKAQREAADEVPGAVRELLRDIRLGNPDHKRKAIDRVGSIAASHLAAVRAPIVDAMRTGDAWLQRDGARALARLGDESDVVIKVLLANLTHRLSEVGLEWGMKTLAIDALSHVRGRPDVVHALLDAAQHEENDSVREWATCALGAIGNPAAREFLEYQSERGNRAARIALQSFGKAQFGHLIGLLAGKEEKPRPGRFHGSKALLATVVVLGFVLLGVYGLGLLVWLGAYLYWRYNRTP